MTILEAVPDCRERIKHEASDVKWLHDLVLSVDPAVRAYFDEAFCCFMVGAYRASIVSSWCGVAEYLRLVLRSVGRDVYELNYVHEDADKDAESEQKDLGKGRPHGKPPPPRWEDWDGRSLYLTCRKLTIFAQEEDFGGLRELYEKRNKCAHPSGVEPAASEVMRLLGRVHWLLRRRVEDERFRVDGVVLDAMQRVKTPSFERAGQLCGKLARDQVENFAHNALRSLLTPERFDRDDREVSTERAVIIWRAVTARVESAGRERLMTKLAETLQKGSIAEIDAGPFRDHVVLRPEVFEIETHSRERILRYVKRTRKRSVNERNGGGSRIREDRRTTAEPRPNRSEM